MAHYDFRIWEFTLDNAKYDRKFTNNIIKWMQCLQSISTLECNKQITLLPVLHLEEKIDDQTRNIVISFPEGISVYLMVHQCPCAVWSNFDIVEQLLGAVQLLLHTQHLKEIKTIILNPHIPRLPTKKRLVSCNWTDLSKLPLQDKIWNSKEFYTQLASFCSCITMSIIRF